MRRPANGKLELAKENDKQKTTILVLRHQLAAKQDHVARLECLLRTRLHRTDELFGLLEQARQRNIKFEAEAEHLAVSTRYTAAEFDDAVRLALRGSRKISGLGPRRFPPPWTAPLSDKKEAPAFTPRQVLPKLSRQPRAVSSRTRRKRVRQSARAARYPDSADL
jgi:hypothetical protein